MRRHVAGLTATNGPRAVALILTVLWLAAPQASARDLTASERAGLNDTARHFESATKDGDGERVVATMPPRLLDDMAKQGGMTSGELRPMLAEYFRKAKRDGLDMTATLDVSHARFASLGDGMPYALIPSQVVAVKGGRKVESRFTTLALIDGDRWFLVAASTPERAAAVLRVYPNLSGVDLGTETFRTIP